MAALKAREMRTEKHECSRAFTTVIPVRFQEVDSYRVVWHGHYLQYLEVARDALCAAGGFTPKRALDLGYTVPIVRFEVHLKRPARLDDVLEVSTRLRKLEVAKLVLDYEVRRLPVRELLATGVTEQVLLNPRGELMLVFPQPVRLLVERIHEFQDGLRELSGEEFRFPKNPSPGLTATLSPFTGERGKRRRRTNCSP